MQVLKVVAKNIAWRIVADRTGDYVAVCDSLGLTVTAETKGELHANIDEALQLLMDDVIADGELEQFLTDQGWSIKGSSDVPIEGAKFDIPWELLNEFGQSGSAGSVHQ